MPRPTLPPTPGSSSDIKARDGPHFGSLQMSFELPPPAIAGTDSRPSSADTKSESASSYHPTSPKSPVQTIAATPSAPPARRRSSAAQQQQQQQTASKDAFTLPPPPTRSRKIIQMKPRGQPEETIDFDAGAGKTGTGKTTAGAAQTKKKQPSATSVAGRKIARKTAHSLIERRRRSKMNEEFGVLKSMIPACTGEMHKLAILQASIDYVRYLEDCVAKLKAQNNNQNAATPTAPDFSNPSGSNRPYSNYDDDEDDDQSDVEMSNSEHTSPSYTPIPTPQTHPALQHPRHMHQPSISPALLPQDSQHWINAAANTQASSSSSADPSQQRHYSYTGSATTSPAFGPTTFEYAASITSANSALTSPALGPRRDSGGRDLDQEATAALLMLNSDRRGTAASARGRSMSVRDLLST